jgi:stearoyl-CoA desaturase (delta-9 desaturase)
MTDIRSLQKPSKFPDFLDYVGYIGMHVTCIGIFWTGVKGSDIALCLSLYIVRMFGLMAGYHRYFSHRAFKTSRVMQFLIGLLGSLGYQKGPLWWASHHRYHHRYSDTYLDVHSPVHRSFLYSHSGWFLDKDNRRTEYARVGDLAKYPELVWLDNWNLLPVTVLAILLLLFFGWSGFIWGFCVNTILIWHAIHGIGSFGHKFGGYRRFVTTDNSRNKWFLALALLGEGWHNNHHYYPSSARQGFVWWELDIAYYILKVMDRLGLIWDLRLPPEQVTQDNGFNSQSHMRQFELWLMNLRLGLGKRIDEIAQRNDFFDMDGLLYLPLLKQSIEIRMDDFDANAVNWIHRNPEQLGKVVDVFRSGVAEEIYNFSDKLKPETITALLLSLDSEFCQHARNCPFKHFFLDLVEVKRHVQERSANASPAKTMHVSTSA